MAPFIAGMRARYGARSGSVALRLSCGAMLLKQVQNFLLLRFRLW